MNCHHGINGGQCSYCLTKFWTPRISAEESAKRSEKIRDERIAENRKMRLAEEAGATKARARKRFVPPQVVSDVEIGLPGGGTLIRKDVLRAAPQKTLDWATATVCRSPQGAPCTFRRVGNESALVFGQLADAGAQFLPPARMERISDAVGKRGKYARYVAYYNCPACKGRHARRKRFAAPDTDPSVPAAFHGPKQMPGGVLAANGGICDGCLADLMQYRAISNERADLPDEFDAAAAWLAENDPEVLVDPTLTY